MNLRLPHVGMPRFHPALPRLAAPLNAELRGFMPGNSLGLTPSGHGFVPFKRPCHTRFFMRVNCRYAVLLMKPTENLQHLTPDTMHLHTPLLLAENLTHILKAFPLKLHVPARCRLVGQQSVFKDVQQQHLSALAPCLGQSPCQRGMISRPQIAFEPNHLHPAFGQHPINLASPSSHLRAPPLASPPWRRTTSPNLGSDGSRRGH